MGSRAEVPLTTCEALMAVVLLNRSASCIIVFIFTADLLAACCITLQSIQPIPIQSHPLVFIRVDLQCSSTCCRALVFAWFGAGRASFDEGKEKREIKEGRKFELGTYRMKIRVSEILPTYVHAVLPIALALAIPSSLLYLSKKSLSKEPPIQWQQHHLLRC